MKDRLIPLRTMAAVGILSVRMGLAHDHANAAIKTADTPHNGYILARQERSQQIEVDFRTWPHRIDEEGCYEKYPDPFGVYHLRVFCADSKTATVLPEYLRDFDFEMQLAKIEGNQLWYGALLVENTGMYNQTHHFFGLLGDGVFKYERLGLGKNMHMEVKKEILLTIEGSSQQEKEFEKLRIVQNKRNITVFYNDIPLAEGQWLSRSDNPVLLGFGLTTNAQWQASDGAHIEVVRARVRAQRVLRRNNPVEYVGPA